MNMTGGPGCASSGGTNVVQLGSGGGGAQQMTPEQRDQMMKEIQDRMKEAEAKRRTWIPPRLQRLPGRERREAAVQAAAID